MVVSAFHKACQHGIHPSYRARINIIGHSRAGKTSLNRRLLGQNFQNEEESTDGIETHRIEFDLDESPLGPIVWSEAELRPEELSKQFNKEVLEKIAEERSKSATSATVQVEASSGRSAGNTKRPLAELETTSSQSSKRPKLSTEFTQSQGTEAASSEAYSTASPETAGVREGILAQLKADVDKISAPSQEQSSESAKGVLRLWDFGGQTEFYTTHHMFLDADAINIIVMDISKPFESKLVPHQQMKVGVPSNQEEFLSYWLMSIATRTLKQGENAEKTKQRIVLVFTHLDMCTSAQKEHFLGKVKETISKFKQLNVSDNDMYFVDNNNGSEEDFRKLRSELQQKIISLPTWGMMRPVKWLQVEAAMRQKVSKETRTSVKYLKMNTVEKLIEDYQMDLEELNHFLVFLHLMGDIVFYSQPALRHVVTLEPQWLVNIFKSLITAEEFIMKRVTNAQEFLENADLTAEVLNLVKTGTVTFTTLSVMWQGEDVEFLTELLQKFDLILPLGSATGKDRKFLVPCMLPQPRKGDCHKVEFSHVLSMIHRSIHTSEFEELFPVDTFPKLIAVCAKSWPIKEEGLLSFRHVSYMISESVVLVLTQPHRSSISAAIWFNPTQQEQNPMNIILKVRSALTRNIAACGIPPALITDIICPHWTLNDYQVCTVQVNEKHHETRNRSTLQPVRNKCICHSQPLREQDFNESQQMPSDFVRPQRASTLFCTIVEIVVPNVEDVCRPISMKKHCLGCIMYFGYTRKYKDLTASLHLFGLSGVPVCCSAL